MKRRLNQTCYDDPYEPVTNCVPCSKHSKTGNTQLDASQVIYGLTNKQAPNLPNLQVIGGTTSVERFMQQVNNTITTINQAISNLQVHANGAAEQEQNTKITNLQSQLAIIQSSLIAIQQQLLHDNQIPISSQDGNMLEKKTDGYFVQEPLSVLQANNFKRSVNLQVDGNVIFGDVRLDSTSALQKTSGGELTLNLQALMSQLNSSSSGSEDPGNIAQTLSNQVNF